MFIVTVGLHKVHVCILIALLCFKITRLIEGTEYEFRVAASNSAGTGPFSSPSDSAFAVDPLS